MEECGGIWNSAEAVGKAQWQPEEQGSVEAAEEHGERWKSVEASGMAQRQLERHSGSQKNEEAARKRGGS